MSLYTSTLPLLTIRKLRNKRFLVRQLDQLLGVARRCVYVLAVLTPNFSVYRSMYALCFILITRVSRLRSVSISMQHIISLRSLMLNSSFSALLMRAMISSDLHESITSSTSIAMMLYSSLDTRKNAHVPAAVLLHPLFSKGWIRLLFHCRATQFIGLVCRNVRLIAIGVK